MNSASRWSGSFFVIVSRYAYAVPDELPDLQSIVDQTVLEVIDAEENLQSRIIAERASAYVARLRAQQPHLNEEEADRVIEALTSGILNRLQQIYMSGGRLGSA